MLILGQLAVVMVVSFAFWHWVPVTSLFGALQPSITALSIVLAAIFVRLNRGLPALDWKSIAAEKRRNIARSLYLVSVEYVGVLVIGALLTLGIIGLLGFGVEAVGAFKPLTRNIISSVMGGLSSFLLCRMAYVVWRDLDIVRLQTAVVEEMIEKERQDQDYERQKLLAGEKLSTMKSTGLAPSQTKTVKWS